MGDREEDDEVLVEICLIPAPSLSPLRHDMVFRDLVTCLTGPASDWCEVSMSWYFVMSCVEQLAKPGTVLVFGPR